MSTYEWLLLGHLVGVALIFAAAGIGAGTSAAAGRSGSAAGVAALLELQHKSDLYLFSVGAVLAIGFGSWLVDEAGYSFSEAWISAAYTLILAMFAIIHAVMVPRVKRARAYAESLGSAPPDAQLKAMLEDRMLAIGGPVLTVILVVMVWLMVARPGA